MEKSSAQPSRSPSIVPLARDPEGNLIEVPDGTVGWRIRRQTGGRPRLHLDSRKQPMVFPLDYTVADVEDILAPGSYLLDATGSNGDALGLTVPVTIASPRNASSADDEGSEPARVVSASMPATSSDVRFLLEANVRSTKMAFDHNERTLALGLRMAETLRDGVQVLATSQADWIKSVSSARGFFRSPTPAMEVKHLTLNAGQEPAGDDEGSATDDDNGNDGGGPASPSLMEQLAPILQQVMQQVLPAIGAWAAKQKTEGGGGDGPAFELRDLVDWKHAHEKGKAHREKKAAEERAAKISAAVAAASASTGHVEVMSLLGTLPQPTVAKLMHIQSALDTEEQAVTFDILQRLDHGTLAELLVALDASPIEDGAKVLRQLIVHEYERQSAAAGSAAGVASSETKSGTGNGAA